MYKNQGYWIRNLRNTDKNKGMLLYVESATRYGFIPAEKKKIWCFLENYDHKNHDT